MLDQKVIGNHKINWFDNESARLNYKQIFEDEYASHSSLASGDEQELDSELKDRLEERDREWADFVEKIQDMAFDKGYHEGRQEGLEEAKAEMDRRIDEFKEMFHQSHVEWKQRQELMDPGILDLVFEISEKIMGVPCKDPHIRKRLDEELKGLFRKIDQQVRPLLWVSEYDYEYVEKLIKDFDPRLTVNLKVSPDLNPGEFELETDRETVVLSFKKILSDFREQLELNSWT